MKFLYVNFNEDWSLWECFLQYGEINVAGTKERVFVLRGISLSQKTTINERHFSVF